VFRLDQRLYYEAPYPALQVDGLAALPLPQPAAAGARSAASCLFLASSSWGWVRTSASLLIRFNVLQAILLDIVLILLSLAFPADCWLPLAQFRSAPAHRFAKPVLRSATSAARCCRRGRMCVRGKEPAYPDRVRAVRSPAVTEASGLNGYACPARYGIESSHGSRRAAGPHRPVTEGFSLVMSSAALYETIVHFSFARHRGRRSR